MKKFTIPLAIAAAASLAACVSAPETRVVSTADYVYLASSAPVVAIGSVRPGMARVGHPMSSTTPVDGSANQVVTMTMRDGSKQTLVTSGSQLRMAESVEIMPDGRIRRFWD